MRRLDFQNSRFHLPNGKTVAVWCRKRSGVSALIADSDIDLEYGERPFELLIDDVKLEPN